jgi:O-antigen ligase
MKRALAIALGVWACGVQVNEWLSTAGVIATAVLVIASGWRNWRALAAWWPVFSWIAWCVLVPLLAGNTPSGTGLARLCDWLLIPVAVSALAQLPAKHLERIGAATLITMLLSCMAAGLQHFGLWPPLEWFEPLRWTQMPFERVYEPVAGVEGRFMAGGLMFHRLKFAHVTGLVVVFALSTRRPLAMAAGVLGLIALVVFPYARSGAVAAALAAAFVVFSRRRAAGLALGAAVALALVAIPSVRARFLTSLSGEGSGERVELWRTGLAAVEEHPLVGVGAGRFRPSLYGVESTPQFVLDNWGKAHNQLLSIAAEVGIPGALLFIGMLALLWRKLWPGALVHFALLSFVHDPLFHPTYSQALMLALALRPDASRKTASAETSAASEQSLR